MVKKEINFLSFCNLNKPNSRKIKQKLCRGRWQLGLVVIILQQLHACFCRKQLRILKQSSLKIISIQDVYLKLYSCTNSQVQFLSFLLIWLISSRLGIKPYHFKLVFSIHPVVFLFQNHSHKRENSSIWKGWKQQCGVG